MSTFYEKPILTVSDLQSSAGNPPSFVLNWSHSRPSDVIQYKLYRHIERKYPTTLANGGPLIDPKNPTDPRYSNNPPVYKFIKLFSSGTTTYTDNLTDLSVHASEGIKQDANGVWRDNNGTGDDVVDQILHANRRLYYKLVVDTTKVAFSTTPFIYTCHTTGVECRSVFTQVRWNTLYYEGDVVWFNSAITNRNRTAVDLTYEPSTNRYWNVWVSGTDSWVYALNGSTGEIIKRFQIPSVNYISGLRVEHDTGNAVVNGNTDKLYYCSITAGTVSQKGKTNTSFVPNGNNGLTLTREANTAYAYVVANDDVVAKCNYIGNSTQIIPRTELGCSQYTAAFSTTYPAHNVLGITNGPDGAVWANGHVPIQYQYTYTTTKIVPTGHWDERQCPGGQVAQEFVEEYERNNWGTPVCDINHADHFIRELTIEKVPVTINLHFLQDIGYVYGVGLYNRGKTNSVAGYPAGVPTQYHPNTTMNRPSWFGVSPFGPDAIGGRPYTDNPRRIPDVTNIYNIQQTGAYSPLPAISQKGLTTDIPETNLTDSSYNIFQSNQYEYIVTRLTWTGSILTFNLTFDGTGYTPAPSQDSDYWLIAQPIHTCVDSQNNIWVLQEDANEQLTLIYQLTTTTVFPSGGNCKWPKLTIGTFTAGDYSSITDYKYGDSYNDADIEYALSRTTLTGLLTTRSTGTYRSNYGICVSGSDIGQQKIAAVSWLQSGTNWQLDGTRVYPNYVAHWQQHAFSRTAPAAYPSEYNSDNTGILNSFIQQYTESLPTYVHPEVSYPNVELIVRGISSTPLNGDEMFWNDQLISNNSTYTSTSGYDDLTVELSANIIDAGTFTSNGYRFYFDDKTRDIGAATDNPAYQTTNADQSTITYTYHDPSINGKPQSRWVGGPAETNGKYSPFVTLNATVNNCYYLSGETTTQYSGSSNSVDVVVWERWPTAKFYVTPCDTAALRQTCLTVWNLTDFDYPVSNNGEEITSETRVVCGYDPLSAQFNDISITRTWPISEWFWTFGDKNTYGGFPINNNMFYAQIGYNHELSAICYTSIPTSSADDYTTEHSNLTSHLYKGPGTYYATLYVKASNTGTTSWNISSGVIDPQQMINTFTIAVTRQINVLEVCPAIEFSGTGTTVSATYSDDIDPLSSFYTTFTTIASNIYSPYGVITGYSPYLDITVSGYITARSLPISAAYWDFGDPYLNHVKADEYTYFSSPTTGWPIWNTSGYYTSGHHTYVMPGLYNITLVPIVSSFQEGYVSNCSNGFEKPRYVYLKEILPIPTISSNAVSGTSPTTILFNTLSTLAGSFPICRVEWDFGDSSPILTLSRWNSADYINYYNTSAYSTDLSDPRNVQVSHIYNRTQFNESDTYTASVSVYACNTNTVATTTLNIGPIALQTFTDVEGDVHLIESRMYHQNNDLLLVFEGQKSLNNYTVLLSSTNI
jgi:hypothetical protein